MNEQNEEAGRKLRELGRWLGIALRRRPIEQSTRMVVEDAVRERVARERKKYGKDKAESSQADAPPKLAEKPRKK